MWLYDRQLSITLSFQWLFLQHMRACALSHFGHVRFLETPWTVIHQAPRSMGFSRQGYWGQWPCPPPGDLPDPGIKSTSLTFPIVIPHKDFPKLENVVGANLGLLDMKGARSFPAGSSRKESAMQETWVWSPDGEGPLEEEMASHSSILA